MKVNLNRKLINFIGYTFLAILICLIFYNTFRKGIYSNEMGMNIAVIGNNSVAIMLLRPDEQLISWVDIPENLKVKIYNSAATYPILSLWKYGNSERKPYEIFERSLGTSLGVAIPRSIRVDGEANIETVLGSFHKLGLSTDLSWKDRWLIRQFVADAVQSKKIIEETIPQKAFDSVTEPDGKVFLTVNSIASLWTNTKFIIEPILSENSDVIVNNLTGRSGFGFEVSRQLESAGMRVIEVKADNSDSVPGTGCMFAIPNKLPISEKFLKDHLMCNKIEISKKLDEKGIEVWLK